jgi:hypothetical protein
LAWLSKFILIAVLTSVLTVSAWAVSLREAADRVARQYDARVVSAETIERNGQRVHKIRFVTRDRVARTVYIPAD